MHASDGGWHTKKTARLTLTAVLGFAAALAAAGTLWAAGGAFWQQDGVPVCTASGNQEYVRLAGDGTGGAILAWRDGPTAKFYARRVYSSGIMGWGTTGVPLCTANASQQAAQVTTDGAGGAIVTWEDYRSGERDIYAQRVLPNGTRAWAADGVPVCTATNHQVSPQIVGDRAGGAIVAWNDHRSGDLADIYAQRVYSDGNIAWATDGISLCTTPEGQGYPQLTADGAGGAIVAWSDSRGGIYAQRVHPDGSLAWATDGISVCTAAAGDLQVIGDGKGGATVIWQDGRQGWTNPDIYAQRLYSDGHVAWAADGVPLCTAQAKQESPHAVSDGAGGAIVVWTDWRNDAGDLINADVYAQRVYSDGTVAWTADGIPLSSVPREQRHPRITGDGMGGAIVTWDDMRSGTADIYAQHVYSDGTLAWVHHGLLVCGATWFQEDPALTSDGRGGAIVAWEDYRNGQEAEEADIYAQRVGEFARSTYLPVVLRSYAQ